MHATLITEVVVIDPDSKGEVLMSIFKHPGGGMFGVDSSFIEQCFEDDGPVVIPDPFSKNKKITLNV